MRLLRRAEKPVQVSRTQTIWDPASHSKMFENSCGDSFQACQCFIVLGSLWLLGQFWSLSCSGQQPT